MNDLLECDISHQHWDAGIRKFVGNVVFVFKFGNVKIEVPVTY